ncbi:REPTOR-binding partner isoform X1 [Phlebotomus argentipes]|uniref:REPTOR-binding partner isoform X1 n=1 Tax=Phlebotomus argentipes TaxID=94469 RepID=UPI0028933123|nr:REPTOR-binding partner isoform X1 [Phlebotomus argentipes]
MDYEDIVNTEEVSAQPAANKALEEPQSEAIEVLNVLQERKETGKRGRKPGRKASTEKIDMKAKLERSRQSARECRARKKLRYQYLEELVSDREKAVLTLRNELERYRQLALDLDAGRVPDNLQAILEEMGAVKHE